MGVTCRAAITIPSWVSEFNHGFSGVHGARYLVFCVLFCRSLFALFDLFSFSFALSFFEWRLLISLLMSSNFSFIGRVDFLFIVTACWVVMTINDLCSNKFEGVITRLNFIQSLAVPLLQIQIRVQPRLLVGYVVFDL